MYTCLSQEIVFKANSLRPKSEGTRRAIKQHQKLSKCLILLYGQIWCCDDQDLIPPGNIWSTTAATWVLCRKVSRCPPMLISLTWLNRLTELIEGFSGAIGTLATNVGAQDVGTKIEVYSGHPRDLRSGSSP